MPRTPEKSYDWTFSPEEIEKMGLVERYTDTALDPDKPDEKVLTKTLHLPRGSPHEFDTMNGAATALEQRPSLEGFQQCISAINAAQAAINNLPTPSQEQQAYINAFEADQLDKARAAKAEQDNLKNAMYSPLITKIEQMKCDNAFTTAAHEVSTAIYNNGEQAQQIITHLIGTLDPFLKQGLNHFTQMLGDRCPSDSEITPEGRKDILLMFIYKNLGEAWPEETKDLKPTDDKQWRELTQPHSHTNALQKSNGIGVVRQI